MAGSVSHAVPGDSPSAEAQLSQRLDDQHPHPNKTIGQSPLKLDESETKIRDVETHLSSPKGSQKLALQVSNLSSNVSSTGECESSNAFTQSGVPEAEPEPQPPQPKHEAPMIGADSRYIRGPRGSSTISPQRRPMLPSAPPPLTGAKRDSGLPPINVRSPEGINPTLIDPDDEPPEGIKSGCTQASFTHRPGFVRKIEGKWARAEFQPDFKDYTSSTEFPGSLGLPEIVNQWAGERLLKDPSKASKAKSAGLLRQLALDGGSNSLIPPSHWYTTYMDKDYTRYGPVCPSKPYYGRTDCRWVMEAELRAYLLSQVSMSEVHCNQ